jgi:hypothetical protein
MTRRFAACDARTAEVMRCRCWLNLSAIRAFDIGVNPLVAEFDLAGGESIGWRVLLEIHVIPFKVVGVRL